MSLDPIKTLFHGGFGDLRVTTASPSQYRPGSMANLAGVKSAARECIYSADDYEVIKKLDRENSNLSKINKIIENIGPDTIVRLKKNASNGEGGVFKGESGVLKKLVFLCRYNKERKAAVGNLGAPGNINRISAAQAKSILEEKIVDLNARLICSYAKRQTENIHAIWEAR
ncbi:hypothetical protein [Pandoraea pulmonicola]|uniref:Uncharacterized protein n=1 Tax=Pandoraea pulmonicola TaxID=93221 RepID=A0AAJ4Z864_PANPU|nr:hypothetical protein [Pandoraea pulmonicola]SUA88604.1 Uncharacterised protein [Pandoraea pulmonicola]